MKYQYLSVAVRTAVGCLALGLLSACGSSYHSPDSGGYTPPPPVQGDAFTNAVQGTVAAVPEDVEPTSIDSIVATEVDDKEPQAVM